MPSRIPGPVQPASESQLTKEFESAEQTITAAGSLTIVHGLGVVPKYYKSYMKNNSAEDGYSAGDEFEMRGTLQEGPGAVAHDRGVMIVPDATNLNIRYGSETNVFSVINKTTGNRAITVNSNWRIIFRAWA